MQHNIIIKYKYNYLNYLLNLSFCMLLFNVSFCSCAVLEKLLLLRWGFLQPIITLQKSKE